MTTRLGLSAMKRHTSYAPLAALGYVWHQADCFAPWRGHVKLGGKIILHELHPSGSGAAADRHRADRQARGAGAPPSLCARALVFGHRSDRPTSRAPRGRQHEGLLQWGKNRHGRQLARVSAPQYHERLVSRVYPGNQTSQACLHPTVAALECLLALPPAQRRRTVLRLDGSLGTDANLNWALWHGYQVLANGSSGKRAPAFARAVPQWEERRTGAR